MYLLKIKSQYCNVIYIMYIHNEITIKDLPTGPQILGTNISEHTVLSLRK